MQLALAPHTLVPSHSLSSKVIVEKNVSNVKWVSKKISFNNKKLINRNSQHLLHCIKCSYLCSYFHLHCILLDTLQNTPK